ncbi:MAG: tol-pal system protein YbgF [Ignavibacteria bacterium]|nr:tol-pal system protein YbgF [Ignavibacteria bacterium]
MSLVTSRGRPSWMNALCFLVLLTGVLAWVGCESSEATRQEQDQEALANLVGDRKPEITPPAPPVDQQKLTALEAENTNLKQKITKLEQDNTTLSARLSGLEAKLLAERAQAEKAVTPKVPPVGTSYEDGMKAFGEKRYDDAIQVFRALLESNVAEDLADNCHYWIGESYFGKKSYAEAEKEFEAVLQYKISEKKADALFMMAQCYEIIGDKAKAKETYEKVVKDYPTSDLVKKARERWGRL